MKASELTGAALDWAVAKCEGTTFNLVESFLSYQEEDGMYMYSVDWAQGGPIIEREKIAVDCDGVRWVASSNTKPVCYSAKTPLIAAMRCYVASKLGEEIHIPEELR